MIRWLLPVVFAFVALPVSAQSAYVAGSLSGDIARFTHTEVVNVSRPPNDDFEAMSWSIRAGTALSSRFGLDLSFVRTSELESDSNIRPVPLGSVVTFGSNTVPVERPSFTTSISTVPIFIQDVHTRRREVSLDTTVWGRQRAGDRVDVLYSGGVAFFRTVQRTEYRARPGVPQPLAIYLPQPFRTTTYDIAPVVGIEARISMTEHLRLLPGVKMYGRAGDGPHGWLVRPAVGLGWLF